MLGFRRMLRRDVRRCKKDYNTPGTSQRRLACICGAFLFIRPGLPGDVFYSYPAYSDSFFEMGKVNIFKRLKTILSSFIYK